MGAAGFLPASSSTGQSWSTCPERGVRARHGEWSGVASPCTGAQRSSLAPTFTWGLSCSSVRRDLWSRWAQTPQCSDSRAPGPCVCSTGPPGSCTGSQLPSPFVPGCGKVSWPRFCLEVLGPQGTPTPSLVLDEPPRLPARPDPLPASFYSAIPHHSSPFILPWPGSSWTPRGQGPKGGFSQPARFSARPAPPGLPRALCCPHRLSGKALGAGPRSGGRWGTRGP